MNPPLNRGSYRTMLPALCAAMIVAAIYLAACKQDPTSTSSLTAPPAAPPSNPAHPALTYTGTIVKNSSVYGALFVSDSDGAHETAIVTGWEKASGNANGGQLQYMHSSWSPTGQSICFAAIHFGTAPDSIMAVDVSVNKNGVPVANNLRCIYAFSGGNGYGRAGISWSATSATGLIALTGGDLSLFVVPQSGGTPTTIYSFPIGSKVYVTSPTWSPDDTRLAVVRHDSTNGSTIMMFNTSTWAYVDSIFLTGGLHVNGDLDWSRTGQNKLAFPVINMVAVPHFAQLDYCDPVTGAVPYSNGEMLAGPISWSPNNSSILFDNNAVVTGLWKVASFSTTTTQISATKPGGANSSIKWRR